MNKFYLSFLGAALAIPSLAATPGEATEDKDRQILNLFDNVVYYDGYKRDVVVDADLTDGVTRHSNSLYAVPLPDDFFTRGPKKDLQLEVLVGALCDNYDRFGRVNLALVPKDAEGYDPDDATSAERIEIARFITPFMDKNKQPDVVPYVYDIQDIDGLLEDTSMREKYNIWVETELFGVPYAANQQIAGCADRNDVFTATVSLTWLPSAETEEEKAPLTLIPLVLTKSEHHGEINFNNYREEATDTLGTTTRRFTFDVPEDMTDAEIYFILTNHGAAEGGEEYVRRLHHVYWDDDIALSYRPGGESCEPYRKYNTQPNGIYSSYRLPTFWRNYSNWCPGQAVPIRRIQLGQVKKGTHSLMVRVPDAVFYNKSGDFRPSVFFLGTTRGQLAAIDEIGADDMEISFSVTPDEVRFTSEEAIKEAAVYAMDGHLVEGRYNPGHAISMADYPSGQYIVVVTGVTGRTAFTKVVR